MVLHQGLSIAEFWHLRFSYLEGHGDSLSRLLRRIPRVAVPLKLIEYGVYGDLSRVYPRSYSNYLRGARLYGL